MKFILALALITSLLGCASSPSIKESYSMPEKGIEKELSDSNKAELRIYRVDAFLQKLATVDVYLNNNITATLSNSSTEKVTIDPGKYRIYAKMGGLDANSGCGFEFEINKGEVVYLQLSPKAGGALPIISILTNPMVCKFDIQPIAYSQGKTEYSEIKANKS